MAVARYRSVLTSSTVTLMPAAILATGIGVTTATTAARGAALVDDPTGLGVGVGALLGTGADGDGSTVGPGGGELLDGGSAATGPATTSIRSDGRGAGTVTTRGPGDDGEGATDGPGVETAGGGAADGNTGTIADATPAAVNPATATTYRYTVPACRLTGPTSA